MGGMNNCSCASWSCVMAVEDLANEVLIGGQKDFRKQPINHAPFVCVSLLLHDKLYTVEAMCSCEN